MTRAAGNTGMLCEHVSESSGTLRGPTRMVMIPINTTCRVMSTLHQFLTSRSVQKTWPPFAVNMSIWCNCDHSDAKCRGTEAAILRRTFAFYMITEVETTD
jgi:hypothetical protein